MAGSLNWVTFSPCEVFLNSLNSCIKAKTSQGFDLSEYYYLGHQINSLLTEGTDI